MSGLIKQLFTKCNRFSKYNVQYILKTNVLPSISYVASKQYSNSSTPYEIVDEKAGEKLNNEIINYVNQQVKDFKQGRLFAVVHVAGKQFKITEGDVIVVEGYWHPNVGDKINLNKVMLVGGADFTLIGTPVVQSDLVQVKATVIEKSLSHTKTHFIKKRRKQYTNINFYRIPQTMLRINKVQIIGEVNNPPEVRGLDTAIF
ncbi:unnamed protein product [Brassicogethes aeneus]|uniref:Large ribosomal subunit protein bL21m n=1 Tax=Brassicogethes aeneus TaxID=1431903 RepID=A0A9P0B986_BRAAE|nr:unnamed protein product [Brassicogethes aeneus]